jgi:hypothetical protein
MLNERIIRIEDMKLADPDKGKGILGFFNLRMIFADESELMIKENKLLKGYFGKPQISLTGRSYHSPKGPRYFTQVKASGELFEQIKKEAFSAYNEIALAEGITEI